MPSPLPPPPAERSAELAPMPIRLPRVALGVALMALATMAVLCLWPVQSIWCRTLGPVCAGVALVAGATALRSLREQVLARERSLQKLLMSSVDWHWETDASLRFTRFSGSPSLPVMQRQASTIGKAPWELPEMVLLDMTDEEHRNLLMAHRPVRDLRVRRINGNGQPVFFSVSGVPCTDAQGRFTGYIGTGRNITTQRATEHAMRRTEELLTHVYATSPDVISLSELKSGRYVMVNPSWSRACGYSAEEAIGKTSLELGLWHPNDISRQEFLAVLERDGAVFARPMLLHARGGSTRYILTSAATFALDGIDYLVINSRDVTESERERQETRAILRNASVGIALTREGRFVNANPCFETMFGWPEGSLAGRPDSELCPSTAERGGLEGAFGLGAAVECEVARRDEGRFWGRFHGQAVDPNNLQAGGIIWIAEDVSEQRRIEQALADARDVAIAASRAKSAFLANTSHEIRTPLNGLVGLAELALKPGLDEARRQQYIAQIGDSARSLAGIISDILDLSKIEAGRFSVDDVPFDLRAMLDAVHHAYKALADARSLRLELQVADAVPQIVRGDPVRLRQILSNYITNGIKFTSRGFVRIEIDASGSDHLCFRVYDSGLGIDEATQARLFQPFTQGDESTTRQFGGTGLGLSICKELAHLMKGRVGMQSKLGAGSCFWVELPLPATDEPAPSNKKQDASPLAGKRVLLVEDNPVNMTIGSALLEQWGVAVSQAMDGEACIAAVEEATREGQPFAAVLMDVQMPKLSGHEAARRLRQVHDLEELPIVALTAAAMVSERDEALAAGMNDFLTKPVDAHKLLDVLLRVVR